jgi:hypothetical protein
MQKVSGVPDDYDYARVAYARENNLFGILEFQEFIKFCSLRCEKDLDSCRKKLSRFLWSDIVRHVVPRVIQQTSMPTTPAAHNRQIQSEQQRQPFRESSSSSSLTARK